MYRFRQFSGLDLARWLMVAALAGAALATPATAKEKAQAATVRWDEQRPGCTFSRSPDGKYNYGLWSADVGLTLSVDSQELEKVHRRHEPFFGVLLTIRYRGQGSLEVAPQNASLEFVKHFKFVQTSLDPDDFSAKIQNDADELDHQTAREIAKHPEQKDTKQAYMRAFQKDTAELQDFISRNSLRPTQLDAANPEVRGWVLFNTSGKWIGSWKKQEEFVLRIPLDGKIFEIPFRLPPKEGELLLRRRE
jgi:hypothetical protein